MQYSKRLRSQTSTPSSGFWTSKPVKLGHIKSYIKKKIKGNFTQQDIIVVWSSSFLHYTLKCPNPIGLDMIPGIHVLKLDDVSVRFNLGPKQL